MPVTAKFSEIQFSDSDVVNPDDFIPAGGYNPHNVRPFLFHDHGFVLGVVFADCLQDALDIAVDNDKLDRYMLDEKDKSVQEDYMESKTDDEGNTFLDFRDDVSVAFLGNASEPFDIESLGVVELPNPRFSFVALFNAMQEEK